MEVPSVTFQILPASALRAWLAEAPDALSIPREASMAQGVGIPEGLVYLREGAPNDSQAQADVQVKQEVVGT